MVLIIIIVGIWLLCKASRTNTINNYEHHYTKSTIKNMKKANKYNELFGMNLKAEDFNKKK